MVVIWNMMSGNFSLGKFRVNEKKKKWSNVSGRKQVLPGWGGWHVPGTAGWLLYGDRVISGENRTRLAEGHNGGWDCCKGPWVKGRTLNAFFKRW